MVTKLKGPLLLFSPKVEDGPADIRLPEIIRHHHELYHRYRTVTSHHRKLWGCGDELGEPLQSTSLPTQGEIDALGGGKTTRDWEARFELVYQKCKDKNVTLVGGVAPTATRFARYL
jgi:hypothetical protein